jgi:NAD(P)H-dependent flavin oxidoreductase YrpB (nitropropane dioxygenase family)
MIWITWAELAAAVSNAGGLGVIGPNAGERTVTADVAETGERLRREIKKTKSLTKKPFGVNIVIPLADYPPQGKAYSDECVKVVLEENVAVVVLVGDDPKEYTKRLKSAGIKVLHRGVPANVKAAKQSENAGVDAFVAVGFEGGGHIGHDCLPNFVLIPQIAEAIRIPVIAGGGIVDGRGMAAALALGAKGIYMGTRFIATRECPAHPHFKQSILESADTSTATCAGRFGVLRGLRNVMLEKCIEMEKSQSSPTERARLYASRFREGMLEGDLVEGTLPCGAGAGMIRSTKSAADVVHETVREAQEILGALLGAEKE